MSKKTLTELANHYGTDKGTVGPSVKWGALNYTDIYQAYLENHRSRTVTLLEIGLGVTGDKWDARIVHGRNTGGASLKMWHDYFPHAKLYGIDLNPASYLDNERISTFVADQGKVEDLQAVLEATGNLQFDFIIDDGSHRPDHQQITLNFFFKHLKSGGLYFIEDLLANGFGDEARGRHAANTVRNTRSIMKHFQQTETFLEPNLLTDSLYMKDHIAYVNFHAPAPQVSVEGRMRFTRPVKTTIKYPNDAERLCVIRKK
jgi:hypothetical protein